MTASNARLLGYISASEGFIGKWQLSNGMLVGENITLDAVGSKIYKTDDFGITKGYFMDFTPDITGSESYYVRFGENFAVSSSGQLIASGAIIHGEIIADTGSIGGWRVEETRLRNDTLVD